ncbi:hypothetical protein AMECASPLE_028651 [Ameca splendens]|uniref:Uncharacterized protein n=1 Tax=Ameca splendens TaxID=208324 RepID=A0ABV0XIQ4_9TELE
MQVIGNKPGTLHKNKSFPFHKIAPGCHQVQRNKKSSKIKPCSLPRGKPGTVEIHFDASISKVGLKQFECGLDAHPQFLPRDEDLMICSAKGCYFIKQQMWGIITKSLLPKGRTDACILKKEICAW